MKPADCIYFYLTSAQSNHLKSVKWDTSYHAKVKSSISIAKRS